MTVNGNDLEFHSFEILVFQPSSTLPETHCQTPSFTCVYNAEVTEDSYSDIVIIGERISTQRLVELAADRFGWTPTGVCLRLGVSFTRMRKQRYWNRVQPKPTCGA